MAKAKARPSPWNCRGHLDESPHEGVHEVPSMSRVLVVEDEAHLAQGLQFNLQAEGYSAEVVGDGEAATDRLLGKKENFDAIVLDIMLPGKDGFSVVAELRAARNYEIG